MFSNVDWLTHDSLSDLHSLKLSLINSGRSVIDLSMINPDIPPPRLILDKLLEATVRPSNHRYAVARGVRKLREAFATKYAESFGVRIDPETQACVTMGCKDAIEHALMCFSKDIGGILVGRPIYPAYISAIKLAGFSPSFFNLGSEEGMLEEIERGLKDGARVVLLNFPNNPTGITVQKSFYVRLAEIAERFQAFVINDFVYGEMIFDGTKASSLLSVPYFLEHGAEVYSLSKAYSVPGWRVGALLGSSELVQRLAKLKAHVDYGVFLPLQLAACTALTERNLVAPVVKEYALRANSMASGLTALGWQVQTPKAGAFIWASPGNLNGPSSVSSLDLARELLMKIGVAVVPGDAFSIGDIKYPQVRFALVAENAKLREVLIRLSDYQKRGAEAQAGMSGGVI